MGGMPPGLAVMGGGTAPGAGLKFIGGGAIGGVFGSEPFGLFIFTYLRVLNSILQLDDPLPDLVWARQR